MSDTRNGSRRARSVANPVLRTSTPTPPRPPPPKTLAQGASTSSRSLTARVADGWSCDCEDAPIVATDGDETVLIAVISAYEEGSARMPELSVGAAEFAIMRRACLLYLADHGDADVIRHDVVSIVVTGERQAKLRHLMGAWQWAESRKDLGRQSTKTACGRNTWRRRGEKLGTR